MISIFVRPRVAIQKLSKSGIWLAVLFIFMGCIYIALADAMLGSYKPADFTSLVEQIIWNAVPKLLVAVLILITLIQWINRLQNGEGRFVNTCHAIAWSFTPVILFLFVDAMAFAALGMDLFNPVSTPGGEVTTEIFFIAYRTLKIIAQAYSIVLLIIFISELHKISIGRSIASVFIPLVIVLILAIGYSLYDSPQFKGLEP